MLLDFLAGGFNVFARTVSRVTAGGGDQSDPCKQEQQCFLYHNLFLIRLIVELLEFVSVSGHSVLQGTQAFHGVFALKSLRPGSRNGELSRVLRPV